MFLSIHSLIIGFCLDLLFGDPHWLPHPVRIMGKLITFLERHLRTYFQKSRTGELIGGAVLVLILLSVSVLVPLFLLHMAALIHPGARLALEGFMCYQLLALKSLKDESMKVYQSLKRGNLEEARMQVSMIVGRDTKSLDQKGIAKAAIETVAENTSDGIIAPMLFMALGGAGLGFFYKAVNTMDSMIGYKNETYLYFGRAAARLDDICNYIPARISAYLMIAASYLLGFNGRNGIKIYKRDRFCHKSPNSAHTEAVCAGALEIQLAGDAWYFGVLHRKPTIGDEILEVEYEDIKRANRLLYGTSFLAMGVVLLFYLVIR